MQISSIASMRGWIIHSHMWMTCSQGNSYNTFSLSGESFFFWTAVSWARRNHNCLNMDLIQLSFASRDLIPYGAHLGFPNRSFPNISPVICIHYLSSWLETTASFNHLLQGLFFCLFWKELPSWEKVHLLLWSSPHIFRVPSTWPWRSLKSGSQEAELVAVWVAFSVTSVRLL